MKKLLCTALAMLMIISLCACGGNEAPPETQPPSERVFSELDLWALNTEKRYNMDYADFAEYWNVICDGYFAPELAELVGILSRCENVDFSLEETGKQIADKRAEYDVKYGEDWSFEYLRCETEPLEERAKEDFAAELQDLYERISVLLNEAAGWSEVSWTYFAEGLGCDTATAERVVELYAAMAEKCNGAQVTEAYTAVIILDYKGTEVSYETWLYRANGAYVSQQLIDNALSLVHMIY